VLKYAGRKVEHHHVKISKKNPKEIEQNILQQLFTKSVLVKKSSLFFVKRKIILQSD
jgi:hypothetical protein